MGRGQDLAYNDVGESTYTKAYRLAYDGDYESVKTLLGQVLSDNPNRLNARFLLASSYSWNGQYASARAEFNKITSKEKNNSDAWISAIKNELYAKENATALGLAYKALIYLKNDSEVERLKEIAQERVLGTAYSESGWFNQKSNISIAKGSKPSPKLNNPVEEKIAKNDTLGASTGKIISKTPADKEVLKNRIAVNNSFTVFDQRYDPMVFSSISFRRQTQAGSIIPRINYSNRLAQHGVQYDLDFYPKFSKRFYAYLNYGYSNAAIYPNHKVGGDLYVNLPGAFEFSAGGRFINFDTKNVSVITNSLGHYRGNYYFSLRSYITPLPNKLTRVSGNILVRKYLKDAENFFGANIGMGYSPELRQLTSGDELLAETILYVESQRLSLEYQFTGKKFRIFIGPIWGLLDKNWCLPLVSSFGQYPPA
ncbi:YaiO family outer membrane beta-barrel protein [Maribacter halichondriae]|uniref:YaiO family outer membrane beta-barrel protein n=1 Tax=Maribacter halichondriae TaxID=2980554 RepID=UPI0023588B27|nr:YaiO family outer membrane beta-barrel protein [Maribacter sp. Hal144]